MQITNSDALDSHSRQHLEAAVTSNGLIFMVIMNMAIKTEQQRGPSSN